MINVMTKLMPTLVKAIGWKGALELLLGASLGAELLNLGVDKTKEVFGTKARPKLEEKQQELLMKRAAKLEERYKAAAAAIEEENQKNEEPVVEEKPKEVSKNKKKSM